MKLFLVEWPDGHDYDKFDSLVCCANTEGEARRIYPCPEDDDRDLSAWGHPKELVVTYLGEADASIPKGKILASFNAG